MKKYVLMLTGLMVSACSGYQPLYSKSNLDFDRVFVESVIANQEENVGKGKRRVAQLANRKLKELLPSSSGDFALKVAIVEREVALAVERDATEERLELVSEVDMELYDQATGDKLLNSVFNIRTYYNVQDTPFATESSIARARETAAEGAAEEVFNRISLFLNQNKAVK